MESQFFKRTWAQINLNAVAHNFEQIRRCVSPKTKILCVIKADAYGHGAVRLAQEYEQLGADWFGVSNFEEAMQLRNGGVKKPMLIFGYTPVDMVGELANFDISQAVFSAEYARRLSEYAKNIGVNVKVHLKVDTGMSRIGFVFRDKERDKQVIDEMAEVCRLSNLIFEGIFTHFAKADEPNEGEKATNRQLEAFTCVCDKLENMGFKFALRHCSNSGGILNYPNANLDMVRAGIILYGLFPSDYIKNQLDLIPVMSIKTVVSQVKNVPSGTAVGYGGKYITTRDTKIATVPIGYADGYLRALSGRVCMLVNGKKALTIGRVCMDQTMIDVTGIDGVKEGSIVTVVGKDAEEKVLIEDLATAAGTINYEILCLFSKRVPRIYIKDGKSVGQLNYICPI